MKRFFRSEKDKKIAGVCGGLGEFFGVDPVLVRAAFLVSIIFGGLGILFYLALWIVAPVERVVKDANPRS